MDSEKAGKLLHLFDNTTQCYKFFWFRSVLEKVNEGVTTMRYGDIVNDMISTAWFMVSEYHLTLGPSDGLEELIKRLQPLSGLRPSESRTKVIGFLSSSDDSALKGERERLIRNVPYCLQSPFFPAKTRLDTIPKSRITGLMNANDDIIYTYSDYRGLDTTITVRDEWTIYLRENYSLIKGWIDYRLVNYLQSRNPAVPGIPLKLSPPRERNLVKIQQYWRKIIEIGSVREIYSDTLLSPESSISIDHFVPWSYVSCDEFWNLSPTTRSINSSKSNFLPPLERYFRRLSSLEFRSYTLIHKYPRIRESFEKAGRDHFSTPGVKEKLYLRENLSEEEFGRILYETIEPLYKGARNCGFILWKG